jgi:hypothetical protein
MPVFESTFFDMPHGNSDAWSLEQLKERAKAAGGKVTDEMLRAFQQEINDFLNQESREEGDITAAMMGLGNVEEQDYI